MHEAVLCGKLFFIRRRPFSFEARRGTCCLCPSLWALRSWRPICPWSFVSRYRFFLWPFFPPQDNRVYLVFWHLRWSRFGIWFSGNVQRGHSSFILQFIFLIARFTFASGFDSCNLPSRFWLIRRDWIVSQRTASIWQPQDQLGFFVSFGARVFHALWLIFLLPRKLSWP